MTALTGQKPGNSYKDLVQVSNSNAGIDTTLRDVEDGEGTASALQVSTTGVKSTGTLAVTGVATFSGGVSGAVAGVTAGTGLSGGTISTTGTLAVDISSLTADGSPDSGADYVMTYDDSASTLKKVLLSDLAGSGDVSGPASATDSAIALFDGTGGKTLKDSTYTITAAGAALLDDASAAAQRTTLGLVIGTDVQAYDATIVVDADIGVTVQAYDADNATRTGSTAPTEHISIACSDETTALTTGTAKATFRMPYAFTLTAVRCSATTAPTGATLTVDINEGGVTILSTKLTIDASEKTSTTAATPAVISDASLADDAEITVDIDQIGSTVAGAGLKVYLIGYKT